MAYIKIVRLHGKGFRDISRQMWGSSIIKHRNAKRRIIADQKKKRKKKNDSFNGLYSFMFYSLTMTAAQFARTVATMNSAQ